MLVKSFNEMVEKLRERKELEEKLKKTEQLSMIGQLASGIAHEVRNPLNFLSLSIGHIKERLAEEAYRPGRVTSASLLDSLKKEIYRVNELINNFLFIGKADHAEKGVGIRRGPDGRRPLYGKRQDKGRDRPHDPLRRQARCAFTATGSTCAYVVINLILNSAQAIEDKGSIIVRFAMRGRHGMHIRDRQRKGRGRSGHRQDIRAVLLYEETGYRPRPRR